MNRINQLFNSNKKDILSIYFCAGTPTLDGTADVIRTLEKHGAHSTHLRQKFSNPNCMIGFKYPISTSGIFTSLRISRNCSKRSFRDIPLRNACVAAF